MTSDNERRLTDSLAALSKGHRRLLSHAGLWIAALSLFAAALATFTDLSLLSLTAEAMTLRLGIYAAATVIIFLSLEEEGERAGRGERPFTEAQTALEEAEAHIKPPHYGRLEDFCQRYAQEELSQRRARILLTHGAKEEAELSKAAARRLRRLRPLPIHAAMLLGNGNGEDGAPLWRPARKRANAILFKLVPSVLCTAFGIGIAIGVRDSLSASAVLEGLFKLSALLVIGLRGYMQGYLFVLETEIPFLQAKKRLLEQFLCEYETTENAAAAS